ncbi:hypothetical protein CCUS01_03496 [Colletotrichum cuscutae]|uniref:Uncharacterized protein n=1 Tax=Colletotrichum cuscutae TaxID=1209917 RepID=A0AAI9Y8L6_9PEZI|nr:hypothetical protein CCUS01_03496 [Colletotrichum cuscutae]
MRRLVDGETWSFDIYTDLLIRSLHTIEQAEMQDILASGPGLLSLCGRMLNKLEISRDTPVASEPFRLASQVWAKTIVAVQAAATLSPPAQRWPHRTHLFAAVRSVLAGAIYVEAGDPTEMISMDFVDLSLLRRASFPPRTSQQSA